MGVKIRLTRLGCRNTASYRVVVTDSRSPRDGRYIESLGWYDPKLKGVNFRVDFDRLAHWQSQGAEISTTVRSILQHHRRAVAQAPAAPAPAPAAG